MLSHPQTDSVTSSTSISNPPKQKVPSPSQRSHPCRFPQAHYRPIHTHERTTPATASQHIRSSQSHRRPMGTNPPLGTQPPRRHTTTIQHLWTQRKPTLLHTRNDKTKPKKPKIHVGNPKTSRDLTYVEDTAEAMTAIAHMQGRIVMVISRQVWLFFCKDPFSLVVARGFQMVLLFQTSRVQSAL